MDGRQIRTAPPTVALGGVAFLAAAGSPQAAAAEHVDDPSHGGERVVCLPVAF